MEISGMDRDFIQTKENLLFCVIGYSHPPNRILSYLKYVPSSEGKWKLDQQPMHRVLPYYSADAVLNTFQFLKSEHPDYLFYDNYSDMLFSAIPIDAIKMYYSTKEKMESLFAASELDSLQKKLLRLVSTLSDLAGLSRSAFGVTGSILLDTHNPDFSDLDLTVHGYKNSLKLKEKMIDLFNAEYPDIQRLDKLEATRWQADKAVRFGLTRNESLTLFQRKWNMGLFQGTRFSIHPIMVSGEVQGQYGDKRFIQKGETVIKARVIEANSLFMPSYYEVADIEIVEGKKVEEVTEIVSYEGLFDSIAVNGEFIRASGELELVQDLKQHKEYYRVVVGSRRGNRKEYIVKI